MQDCCQPFHEGKGHPGTPEAALRARFSAFSKGEVDYLLSTDKRELEEGRTLDQLKRCVGDPRIVSIRFHGKG